MSNNHDEFPDLFGALLIIAILTGFEMLVSAGFYDAGIHFLPGDPASSVISVLAFGAVLSPLPAYKKLG